MINYNLSGYGYGDGDGYSDLESGLVNSMNQTKGYGRGLLTEVASSVTGLETDGDQQRGLVQGAGMAEDMPMDTAMGAGA
jgi:hypothetical protein